MKLIKRFLYFNWGVPMIGIMFILSGVCLAVDPDINTGYGYKVFADSWLPEIGAGFFALVGLIMLIKGLLEELNDYLDKQDNGSDGPY